MHWVKILFSAIYVIVMIFILVVAVDFYGALKVFQEWGWFKYPSEIPKLGRKLLYFISALMAAHIILDFVYYRSQRIHRAKAQNEIAELKNKLYEKAQEETTQLGVAELDSDDSI